jgi:ribosomal protein S12 methylthiotransferase accessory factor
MSLAEAASMDCCVALDDLPIRPMVKVTPDSTVEWIPGECLNSGEAIWLPRQMMDLNLTERNEENWIFASSTNGLASGNSREEALIHGICEVVERDHSAFFQIKQQFAPYMASTRLRLETIDDAGVIDLIRRVENAGLSITVWDMATDLGLPCFSAVVYDENRSTLYPTKASGAGCHPLKHIALARAVTEALQSRLTFVAGARDDIYWETYREEIPINAAKNRAWLEERQYEACQTDYAEIPDFCRGATNATGLLQGLVRALAEKGWERVIATDLTSTDLGVPVTHVAIPGMEPYLRGTDYCPGRRMMALINELLQL